MNVNFLGPFTHRAHNGGNQSVKTKTYVKCMWKMIEFNNWGTNCQMPCNYFTDPNTTIWMATYNFLSPDQHNLWMT